ncbi:MAG TPA: CvpA family protein [Candidatus Blautia avicola]|uniref:CvpA family protein n=1 Tax=Candidatus Blautia avicola TaxID=2838483 RepID=A0A9D2QW94_9FIRM|nr:CvpA family protein [Candidatus Blautia avicola]
MNWFSIVILAIPVAHIFSGLQKGMVRTAFSFLSVILTLALSFALNPQITKFVQENTPIYHMIQENCQESLMKDTEVKINEKTDSGEQNQFIQELPLPENVKALLIENNNAQGYQHLLAETFTEYISRSIAAVAVSILGMIVTFLAISIILHIIGGILNSIFSLPVLNLFNRVGGAALGIIQGVFVVWIIFLALSLFWDTSWAQTGVSMVKENPVTNYLYENNLLAGFLSGLL